MFGVASGFDIIIGNPPYISTKGVSAADRKGYESEFGKSEDTYLLFTLKGVQLCKEGGLLCFITPKTFWSIQTKLRMREALLCDNTLLSLFDTANPFAAAVVDTCVWLLHKAKPSPEHKLRFLDGSQSLQNPIEYSPVRQKMYADTNNLVIFKPTPLNLAIWERYGTKVKTLYETWWEKIRSSDAIAANRAELATYRAQLRPGDVTLLGCLTDGGIGLGTANNGRFVAMRASSPLVAKLREARVKRLADAMKKYPIRLNSTPTEWLSSHTEPEIADQFDAWREAYGRDIFGRGFIYRVVDEAQIADVETITEEEKYHGIAPTRPYYVPYDKGDRDGNRWYAVTPFVIAWSQENVQFLKTNSGKKGEGMPVIRNIQFYLNEGFCWNNVVVDLKARIKEKTIYDVMCMSLFPLTNLPSTFFISVFNTRLMSEWVNSFINSTIHLQINDARLIPIVIPNKQQLNEIVTLAEAAIMAKKAGLSTKEMDSALEKLIWTLYAIEVSH